MCSIVILPSQSYVVIFSIVLTTLRFLLSATVARLLKVRPPLWGRSASRIGETTHTDCSSALSDQADGRFSTLRVRVEGWPTWTHTGGCFSFHVPSGGQLWKKSSPGGYRHIQWGKLIKSHTIGKNMDQEDFPELKIDPFEPTLVVKKSSPDITTLIGWKLTPHLPNLPIHLTCWLSVNFAFWFSLLSERPDCVMATSLRRWPHLNDDVNGNDDDDHHHHMTMMMMILCCGY